MMFFGASSRLHAVFASARLRPPSLSLRNLLYSTPHFSASSSYVQISLHLPYPPEYTFLSLTLCDCEWKGDAHHASIANALLEFHLFPLSPQTFITVVLDQFRIRIFRSENTPRWIEAIRRDLVDTILHGLYTRLDHLRTNIIFDTALLENDTGDYNPQGGESNDDSSSQKCNDALYTIDDHEAVVSFTSSEWHIKNPWGERYYSFGTLDAQLRRAWDPEADRGSFVLIAEKSSWILFPPSRPAPRTIARASMIVQVQHTVIVCYQCILFLIKLLLSPVLMAINAIRDPMSTVALHVLRLDVTFDRFRLRDAELVLQGAEFVARQYKILNQDSSVGISGFLFDILAAMILGRGSDPE